MRKQYKYIYIFILYIYIHNKARPAIIEDFVRYTYHIPDRYTRTASHLHFHSNGTNLSKTGIRHNLQKYIKCKF